MAEEAEQELLVAANAADAPMGAGHRLADLQVAAGELATLEIGPQALRRVQIASVGRRPFDLEPATLGGEEGLHDLAVVAAEAIPEQEHGLAAEGAAHLLEKADQAQVVVGVGPEVELEPSPTAIPAIAEPAAAEMRSLGYGGGNYGMLRARASAIGSREQFHLVDLSGGYGTHSSCDMTSGQPRIAAATSTVC